MAKRNNKFANQTTVKEENKSAETAVVTEAAAPAAEEVKVSAAPAAEVKTEAPAKKAAAEKKPAAKKASAKKAEKAPEADEKPAAKKASDKTAKVVVQFKGKEYDTEEIVNMCKAAYKADNSRKQVRSLEVYIKPEEDKAYYVVNGKGDGLSIDL